MRPSDQPVTSTDTSRVLSHVPAYPDYQIVVADDEPEVVALIERIVSSRLKATVLPAYDGDSALRLMEENSIDCFVTDMNMPGLHGLDIVRKVKGLDSPVPILVMTGFSTEFPYMAVLDAGADDFINKPFGAGEIEAKLVRIFRERTSERARAHLEGRYRSLFEFSADGMVMLNEESFEVEDANRAFYSLVKCDDALGQPIFDFFDERDRIRLQHWLSICARSGKGTMADLVLASGAHGATHVDISVSFIGHEDNRFVFMGLKDVTEKREVANKLAEAAQRDELTGLLNKRSFQNHIEGGVNRARRVGVQICLLLIDLDNFKQCNDTHGHQIGDKLLLSVGDAIHKSIRAATSDAGFRCGGDEFAVIVFGTNAEGATRVAERIQNEFAKQECYGTTMSIGVAEYAGGVDTETFIRQADDALYKAKGSGKNTISVA